MIWYKFHIGDYLTHTIHLADAEDLAYRRLLDLYYMSEKAISLDIRLVSRKIRIDEDITESVLNEFFERTEEGYFNHRCSNEVAKYQAQVATNQELGSMGGRPPLTDSEGNPIPKKKQIKKKNIITSKDFDRFWSVWPASKRKVGKSACQSKWIRHELDEFADAIIASVNGLKVTEQWTSGYEPAPLTYINQRRWEDDAGLCPSTESVSSGRRVI